MSLTHILHVTYYCFTQQYNLFIVISLKMVKEKNVTPKHKGTSRQSSQKLLKKFFLTIVIVTFNWLITRIVDMLGYPHLILLTVSTWILFHKVFEGLSDWMVSMSCLFINIVLVKLISLLKSYIRMFLVSHGLFFTHLVL